MSLPKRAEGFEDEPYLSCERVAKKKLTQLTGLDPLVVRRRLFAFLVRRGYHF